MELYAVGHKCGVWANMVMGTIVGHGISYPDSDTPELRYHVKLDEAVDGGTLAFTHILVHPNNLRVYVTCECGEERNIDDCKYDAISEIWECPDCE